LLVWGLTGPSLMGLPVIPEGTSGSGLARICGRTRSWSPHSRNTKGTKHTKKTSRTLCSLRPSCYRRPLLARSPTRLPPWPWRCAGRVRAFPLGLLNRVSGRSSFSAAPCPSMKGAPGAATRWHALLSRNKSQIRSPAEHKCGFLPSDGRNPVQRALARKRSSRRKNS
jgi:hypothetical protein